MTEEEKQAAEKAAADAAEKEAAEKAAAEEAAKGKIKFDAAQTKFINELFDRGFRQGAEKKEAELQAKLEEEKKQREAIAAELEAAKKATPPKEENKPDPRLEQFQAQLAEIQGVLVGIKTERDELKKRVESADTERRKSQKKDKFLEAMKEAKINFFDPLEAYELAEKDGYEWDKDADKPVVLNKSTNRPKLNDNGEAMSVLDFVKDFANRKKYLVQAPTQDGGSGSSESRRQELPKEKPGKSFADMTNEEFMEFTQKVMNGQGK